MEIKADFPISEKEKIAYLNAIQDKNGGTLDGIEEINLTTDKEDPDYVVADYTVQEEKFERIRRINCSPLMQ